MTPRAVSIKAASRYRNSLSWAALITGLTALIGSWASLSIETNWVVDLLLGLSAAWAVICQQAEGLILGKVINIRTPGIFFVVLALLSPEVLPLLAGIFAGAGIYMILLAYAVMKPKLVLESGDRFYRLEHPLSRFVPLMYFTSVPLSKIFDPVFSFHWTLGPFNIRVWKLSVFDPESLHEHIREYGRRLTSTSLSWYDTLTSYRTAVGLLYLLDSLSRYEKYDLDGVALAASARLALWSMPGTAKVFLGEVLKNLKPHCREQILLAFDLTESPLAL